MLEINGKIKGIQWDEKFQIGSTPLGNFALGTAGVMTDKGFVPSSQLGALGLNGNFIAIDTNKDLMLSSINGLYLDAIKNAIEAPVIEIKEGTEEGAPLTSTDPFTPVEQA